MIGIVTCDGRPSYDVGWFWERAVFMVASAMKELHLPLETYGINRLLFAGMIVRFVC